jgi:DNA polymerase III delta subunit
MLYVYHGQDVPKSLEKARTLIDSLRAKRPDASYVEVVADSWSPSIIEENVGGQGLFSNKYIIFLNRVTENADAKEVLPDFIQIMNESTNIFILLEGKLNVDLKRAVEKHAEKVVETGEKEAAGKSGSGTGKKEEFNIFALADALGSRNALKSWSMYRQAIDNGQEPESIVGMLFWKIKSMITAKNTKSYSEEELSALMTDLIKVYHDGHRGIVDMELGVEKRLLNLKQ